MKTITRLIWTIACFVSLSTMAMHPTMAQSIKLVNEPLSLTKGKSANVKVRYSTSVPSIVQVQLFDSKWKKVTSRKKYVTRGSSSRTLTIPISRSLASGGNYIWQAVLTNRSWKKLDEDVAYKVRINDGDTADTPLRLIDNGVTFIDPNTEKTRAAVNYTIEDKNGNEVAALLQTRWRAVGTTTWYDHTSTKPFARHSQKLPAGSRATSNPPATIGSYLMAGQEYEREVTITNPATNRTVKIKNVRNFTAPSTQPTGNWTATHIQPLPAGDRWVKLDGHDTGYLTPNWAQTTKQKKAESRVSFKSPDGMPAYKHHVRLGDVVHPMSFDSPFIPFDPSKYSKLMMRFHVWYDSEHPFSGREGKIHLFNVGRGMVAWRTATSNPDVGTGWGGANAMHPSRGTENGLRLLAFHNEDGKLNYQRKKYYGTNVGRGNVTPPTGEWLAIDIILDRDDGWSLAVNGVKYAKSINKTPIKNYNKTKAVWYRHRNMFGGKPEKLPPKRESIEYFGGFFVYAAR